MYSNNMILIKTDASTAPGRVEGGGQPVLSFEQCYILFQVFLSFLRLMLGA